MYCDSQPVVVLIISETDSINCTIIQLGVEINKTSQPLQNISVQINIHVLSRGLLCQAMGIADYYDI